MAEITTIGFRFSGGIAAGGQLNFYEAGRSQYAAARMLYAIEHFRNTGEVVERIRQRINADFRIGTPNDGSYLQEVMLYAAPLIGDFHYVQSILQIPFDKLFPFLLNKVIPRASGSARLADIAEKQVDGIIQLAASSQEREKTAQVQAVEETKRLKLLTDALKGDPAGLRDNGAESKEIARVIRKYAETTGRLLDNDGTASFIAAELGAELNRDMLVAAAEDELNLISPAGEQRMVERIRKLFPEIGQPLQRSSEKFDIELNKDETPVASLNRRRIEQIAETTRDDKSIDLEGNFIKLDKETGFGRFRPTGSRTTLSFSIARDTFIANHNKFIDAFTSTQVKVCVLPFRDGIGNITKLIVLDVS